MNEEFVYIAYCPSLISLVCFSVCETSANEQRKIEVKHSIIAQRLMIGLALT